MIPAKQDVDCVPRLSGLLESTNEWLRYAEAKNGAIVAAALALSMGLLSLLDWTTPIFDWSGTRWYVVAIGIQLIGAACVALASFLPRTEIGRLIPRGDKSDSDNLLYFGHVAKYSPKFLVQTMRKLASLDTDSSSAIERAYAEQVVVNSRIAWWKLRCATWAIRLFLAAIITPVGAFFLETWLSRRRT